MLLEQIPSKTLSVESMVLNKDTPIVRVATRHIREIVKSTRWLPVRTRSGPEQIHCVRDTLPNVVFLLSCTDQ